MGNLGPDVGFTRDSKHLVQGLVDFVVLVPHVAGVNAIVRSRDLRQFDDLVCLGENTGMINQTSREPDGAIFHGLVHQGFHRLQLFRCGRPVENAAHCLFADGVMAD